MRIKIMPWLIMVAISKDELKKKKELIPGSGILLAETYADDDNYRLQNALVVQVGENLSRPWEQRGLPGLQPGDTLIFHHGIERDREETFLYEDDEYDYHFVANDGHNILGWEKPNGEFIADYNHIWCRDIPAKDEVLKSGIIKVNSLDIPKILRGQLEQIDDEIKYVGDSAGDVAAVINPLKKQGEEITNQLNKRFYHRLVLDKINSEILPRFDYVQAGDIVLMEGWIDYKGYPLNYKGVDYLIVKSNLIAAVIRKESIVPTA